jgi:hypothetical protein
VSSEPGAGHKWYARQRLNLGLFDESLAYFRQRYFSEGEFTYHFRDLKFRSGDHRSLVESVLRGTNQEPPAIVSALLIIVYRLRNNLFHGEKWVGKIYDQKNNFDNANQILMMALETEGPDF